MREEQKTLKGRKLYVPNMCWGSVQLFSAAFASVGIDTEIVPPSNAHTLQLGRECTSGDECYPQQVTIGDFLGILEKGDRKPHEIAFFMPRAEGPCRFGQYAALTRKILREKGYGDAYVFSPTSENGYKDIGGNAQDLERRVWHGIITADILRKYLLKTRPYEKEAGSTDAVYEEEIAAIGKILENPKLNSGARKKEIKKALKSSTERFKKIPINPEKLPRIGIIGEIFVRQNEFSNDSIIRKLERHGAETILTGLPEWVSYTKWEEQRKLRDAGKRFSKDMLTAKIRSWVQLGDDYDLRKPFKGDLKGLYGEPRMKDLLPLSDPYLPHYGALGEMTLNAANAVHFHHAGADGVIDLSPFSCMNGIISEAVYPVISRDHNGFPIRIFYFDGTQSHTDRDIGIFMELVRNYQQKKSHT